MNKLLIDKKTVLITGASSGIGKFFALEVAARGGIPILLARRKERLIELANEIKKKYKTDSFILPLDLLDSNYLQTIDAFLVKHDISVDILINNAGFGYNGDFLNTEPETYTRMNTLNMNVLTELSYHFANKMIPSNSGGILNVASMAGFSPIPLFTVYAATKAFVLRFSQALWHEMKPMGIHVSCLCPGPVETEFFEVAGAKPAENMMRNIQKADDVAKIGLDGLIRNIPVVPTSTSLKILSKLTGIIPDKLSMNISEKIMREQTDN